MLCPISIAGHQGIWDLNRADNRLIHPDGNHNFSIDRLIVKTPILTAIGISLLCFNLFADEKAAVSGLLAPPCVEIKLPDTTADLVGEDSKLDEVRNLTSPLGGGPANLRKHLIKIS